MRFVLSIPDVVKLIVAFKNVADKLGPNVAAIKSAQLIEHQTSKSVAGSKNGLKELLVSIFTDVAAALFALANDTKMQTYRPKRTIVQVTSKPSSRKSC